MLRMICLIFPVILLGCGGSREEVIHIKPAGDPFAEARALLQRYAEGQPLMSEVTSFPNIVENARKADPARAEILEKGLDDIKANPATRVSVAKGILQKLQPDPK